jgi:hypothetical protein
MHGADNGQSESKAYETRDVKLRPLVVFIAGLAVVGVVVYLVVFLMIRLFSGQAATEDARVAPSSASRPAPGPGGERLPPEPRIQVNAAADMDALRRQEDARLTTYGWVDRQAGIVRIPVDVAMTQILTEGLAVRQPGGSPAAAGAPLPKTPQGEAKKVPQ